MTSNVSAESSTATGASVSTVPYPPGSPVGNYDHALREVIESVVVAVVLAFLFRGFVAEAFVIPTGSMAPTLQGRHMDVVCSQCGFQYRTGASVENDDPRRMPGEVTSTRCPICRFSMVLNKQQNANQSSFNGDRILVSKSAYQFSEPQRWDVIVFRFPGEAKTNYIKRLVGLPGETIRIRHGDIYTLDPATANFLPSRQKYNIARKSPEKLGAMLQLIDDTHYVGERLIRAGWPSRWNDESQVSESAKWQIVGSQAGFVVAAGSDTSWLRYRHLIPRNEDWECIEKGIAPNLDLYSGQLITDYYAYNDSTPSLETSDAEGKYWVGDLAVDCDIKVESGDGELLLDLVEGGTHFRCAIALSTGEAVLSVNEIRVKQADQTSFTRVTAKTAIRGSGNYQLRFANIDDQLFLWANGKVVEFDGPTTFVPRADVVPQWSARDPGDLAPVGVGARNARLQVTRLRVLRDVYYRAVEPVDPYHDSEYDRSMVGYGFDIGDVMADPHSWQSTRLFAARRSVTYRMGGGQFFPLGDNSPQSMDARLWSKPDYGTNELFPPPYVDRDLLIGKALMVYWPHAWRAGTGWLPVVPNFQRMGMIR